VFLELSSDSLTIFQGEQVNIIENIFKDKGIRLEAPCTIYYSNGPSGGRISWDKSEVERALEMREERDKDPSSKNEGTGFKVDSPDTTTESKEQGDKP